MHKRRSLQQTRIEYVWAIWVVSAISCHLVLVSYKSHWVRSFLFCSFCWQLCVFRLAFYWWWFPFFFRQHITSMCQVFILILPFAGVSSCFFIALAASFRYLVQSYYSFYLVLLLLLVILCWFLLYIAFSVSKMRWNHYSFFMDVPEMPVMPERTKIS